MMHPAAMSAHVQHAANMAAHVQQGPPQAGVPAPQ
jgi:hypothetical protein